MIDGHGHTAVTGAVSAVVQATVLAALPARAGEGPVSAWLTQIDGSSRLRSRATRSLASVTA
jgi:hypothetical protein